MHPRLIALFESVRASFWFMPSFLAVAAVALSFLTVALDRTLTQQWLRHVDWIFSGGAEGASAVLGTIASSMITIAGVVFSLTLVALSLASSQFGSRLLRNFMRDSTNQLVLGTFIATFLYCLLVLRTIRREDEGAFVPHLSVTIGLVLAAASLWMLIYFIHHVSVSIQADQVVARVGRDLDAVTERLFGQLPAEDAAATPSALADGLARNPVTEMQSVPARGNGYLQLIDTAQLVSLARSADAVFHLARRPGHYIVDASPLVQVASGHGLTPELIRQIQNAFLIGNQRSAAADVEFGLLQLVEIAVRALSPGINDPFTAMTCIDRLGSALTQLARCTMPSPRHRDEQGVLRVLMQVPQFTDFADAVLHPLRQYARTNVDVTLRLLETIAVVGGAVQRPPDRATLRRHADMIMRSAQTAFDEAEDRLSAAERHQRVLRALQG